MGSPSGGARVGSSGSGGPRLPQGRVGLAIAAAAAVAGVALVALVVLLVLSHMPVFTIEGIDAEASEHVSSETIGKLAAIEEGTTLLNVDVGQVQQNVGRNPWVKSVNVRREFPDRIAISVEERSVWAIVVIGSGSSVWALGDDGTWIEPVQLGGTSGDVTQEALAKATELGCLLISQVPSSVDPAQGSEATDDVIQAVLTYQRELGQDLSSQAQTYYASSEGSISMVLKSGLEVSLGAPTDIPSKQAALAQIMATYPDQLTYVNVRVPSKPTYRKVSASNQSAQTAATTAG